MQVNCRLALAAGGGAPEQGQHCCTLAIMLLLQETRAGSARSVLHVPVFMRGGVIVRGGRLTGVLLSGCGSQLQVMCMSSM